ncbi:hypothetical protein [Bacillus sp. B15-48]|uniref:hypothetical protein n=1 Tax=Bacillus sp. B15-48 TaxID=1548601 RepID=UPI00193F26CF|nr:hypothetical protein [Bacillus sp. B15-48]MBM4760938.1 hypothetical protein [Bacillus sp. B15-48]
MDYQNREKKQNNDSTSPLDGQEHGGMMESLDQFANIVAETVSNMTDNEEENKQRER